MFSRSTLRRTKEFERISALPRREWTEESAKQTADYYTRQLKASGGTMSLRPIQGVALHEISQVGGLFGPIRVGGGKTLLSLLAPRILSAIRPVLLLPAALVEKTKRESGHLMQHWNIPRNIQIQSYEMLGREGSARFFDLAQPDLLVLDEAHRAKNTKAGVTRRIKRWMQANPQTRMVAISGSFLKDDIEDMAHLMEWCLKDWCPIPLDRGEMQEWSECLGKQDNPMRQVDPGPIADEWARPEDRCSDRLAQGRKAFQRRLLQTPGVVGSGDEQVACSLLIEGKTYAPEEVTDVHVHKLRTEMETPDGWALSQAVDVWRHARELALGFHYVWSPRPPMEWLEARRNWAKYVRHVLSHSRSLDTEKQVRSAVENGQLGEAGRGWLAEWQRWESTFTIQPKAIWHDYTALEVCAQWAKRSPGIVWVGHSFFGHELARITGLDYYGEQGLNGKGESLDALAEQTRGGHVAPRSIIASARANSTGRNLQAWARNLVTAPSTGAPDWEQLLGRTHRDGQMADTVTVDVLMGVREHWDAFDRAVANARQINQTMGQAQKLLLADIVMPLESDVRQWASRSWRWQSSGRD